MPGVAGPIWYYEDIIVELTDTTRFHFNPGSTDIIDTIPRRVRILDVADKNGNSCIGCEITDAFDDDNGGHYLAFTDGRFFEHSCQPGGSCLRVGSFADWNLPEDYDELASLIRTDNECELTPPSRRTRRWTTTPDPL